MDRPSISVVVVNYNGREHLTPCFQSLLRQTYPADRIELILVDNASRDGSRELMAEQFPTVRLVANERNVGFSPAVNQGARIASGQYVAFLNNDAYADPDWIEHMVTTLEAHREEQVVCVGAVMLDWHGRRIDFAGGGVNFYGMGNQFFHALPVNSIAIEEHELLFACGGAMLIDRDVFLRVGGFDEDYFAYFEDVDLGWRLWVYGYRVMLAPRAIVHHRQHATASSMYGHQINTLFERNALVSMLKNYDDDHLQRLLGVSLLLMMKRSLSETGAAIDRAEFHVGYRNGENGVVPEMRVPKMAMSQLVALHDIFETFPHIWEKRRIIQQHRARPDAEIMHLFGYPLGASYHKGSYLQLQQTLVDAFDVRAVFAGTRQQRILILSSDPLYENLAGPGIRVVEIARYLAQHCHVVLAAPDQAAVSIPGVDCVAMPRNDLVALERLVTEVEVVIVQGFAVHNYPFLKSLRRVLVVDLYDPFHLENLQLHSRFDDAARRTEFDRDVVNELLDHGDFFICASERQRDFWLGALGSRGRLAPELYRADPTFRALIDVVPFGLEPTQPAATRRVLKGVAPGIAADDTVVLWGGGIWDWLDPLTPIRAMALIRDDLPHVKLYFMGARHPNPVDVPPMEMYDRALALAEELGLLNETVFFNDRWVPYAERASYLLEADIGISAHQEHVETRFAFRTRMLDYIWAGLPLLVTAGDTLADTVAARGLGKVVPVGDVPAFADGLRALAEQSNPRASHAASLDAARADFAWPKALRPLLDFCQRPRYAPDKHRISSPATAQPVEAAALPSVSQRMEELEAVVTAKNAHIVYLEGLIKQIQQGRLMRLMRLFGRS